MCDEQNKKFEKFTLKNKHAQKNEYRVSKTSYMHSDIIEDQQSQFVNVVNDFTPVFRISLDQLNKVEEVKYTFSDFIQKHIDY